MRKRNSSNALQNKTSLLNSISDKLWHENDWDFVCKATQQKIFISKWLPISSQAIATQGFIRICQTVETSAQVDSKLQKLNAKIIISSKQSKLTSIQQLLKTYIWQTITFHKTNTRFFYLNFHVILLPNNHNPNTTKLRQARRTKLWICKHAVSLLTTFLKKNLEFSKVSCPFKVLDSKS